MLGDDVRILGRGPGRSRALKKDKAHEAMGRTLWGEAAPEAIGALLMRLRMKSETAPESAGLHGAAPGGISAMPGVGLDGLVLRRGAHSGCHGSCCRPGWLPPLATAFCCTGGTVQTTRPVHGSRWALACDRAVSARRFGRTGHGVSMTASAARGTWLGCGTERLTPLLRRRLCWVRRSLPLKRLARPDEVASDLWAARRRASAA